MSGYLILKDETKVELEEYGRDAQDSDLSFTCNDISMADVQTIFSDENCEAIKLYSDTNDELIAEYSNFTLGNKIVYDTEAKTVKVTLAEKTTKEQLKALQELVAKLVADKEKEEKEEEATE